ncbi:MerR family transcriptional regulator [Leifsonia sp. NPDC058248]|uniref:transcriptional regulator FtsR n=1 Tax=Leifsonia sp. NPDC058248 TaxID=3346402 RepID=UPI0036DE5E80
MARQAARVRSASPALLSIGQVLARLTPEFPDLSSSKLRFLEERGLISPSRTASGYRKFSSGDLERLRVVLGMQRDHYLPLKVIKAYLADLDAGLNPQVPGATAAGPSMLPSGRRFKRAELLREAGASAELLHDAVAASVLTPAEVYGEESLTVLKALVELGNHGIEPRHLRGFRAAAEREIGLIETALVPIARRNEVSSRAQTVELAREIAGQLDVVRGSIIRSALSRLQP